MLQDATVLIYRRFLTNNSNLDQNNQTFLSKLVSKEVKKLSFSLKGPMNFNVRSGSLTSPYV